ncbi:hypothetical protein MUN76_15400 [Leucobacter rhizosphaerae]|uniref:Uncharacterized protein n=1 Tax=Leucobacter rhizosphaerae TaxID=2932245 RepID=A0ABY4FVR7_9MICO|nr:hypothetical protein [Leucobacter rhizosphaerae]UOQ60394.1 hypothetical protein MUN76_15400 [Leucobacter rhizosphaerae]
MSFLNQAKLAQDKILLARVAACAAIMGITNPEGIVRARIWEFSAQNGWNDAYSASTADEPGADESAVTDAMILEAVTNLLAEGGA